MKFRLCGLAQSARAKAIPVQPDAVSMASNITGSVDVPRAMICPYAVTLPANRTTTPLSTVSVTPTGIVQSGTVTVTGLSAVVQWVSAVGALSTVSANAAAVGKADNATTKTTIF